MATTSLKDAAIDFLTRIVAGDIRGAYDRHAGAGFRHHNPYFRGDADSLRKGMEEDEAKNPGIAELWDVAQPAPAKIVNEHGMF
jgi:hypothetical protein